MASFSAKTSTLELVGITFEKLHTRAGLLQLDAQFLTQLQSDSPHLYSQLQSYRSAEVSFSAAQESALIIELAPVVAVFLSNLFGLDPKALDKSYQFANQVVLLRQNFVEPVRKRTFKPDPLDFATLHGWLLGELNTSLTAGLTEAMVAEFAQKILIDQAVEQQAKLRMWCYWLSTTAVPEVDVSSWYAFWRPKPVVDLRVTAQFNHSQLQWSQQVTQPLQRDDFSKVAHEFSLPKQLLHAHYCLTCHQKQIDYCRSGFYKQKNQPEQGYRQDSQQRVLHGCPLRQHISEMHWFKQRGMHLAALIAVMINNPLCALTGHRICNDCMSSCIYQKQEPVDTPQLETQCLADILKLPWGVEIYDLLLRWHPLRADSYLPKPSISKRVLVMGLGPAGISLLHHLWMQGVDVVGMDGADLHPWPYGEVMQPVRDFSAISTDLSTRTSLGFGGVAEYGITVRWDKNFLQLLYLSFLRRQRMLMLGGIRFGGTVQIADVWKLGFDHLALALGAGLPQALAIPNSMAPGMIQANDFLMALQQLGGTHKQSLLSLSLNLPCLVIGAGLTAVDTATEAQAYYLQMVQLVYKRWHALLDVWGERRLYAAFSEQERDRLLCWVVHGEQLLTYRSQTAADKLDYSGLLQRWGGVALVYRRGLTQSPAYCQNVHELQQCLDQGVRFYEHTTVVKVELSNIATVAGVQALQPWSPRVCLQDICITSLVFSSLSGWVLSLSGGVDQFTAGMVLHLEITDDCVESSQNYWHVVSTKNNELHLQPWPEQTDAYKCLRQVKIAAIRLSAVYRILYLPAASILVATGAKPNIAYGYEHRDSLVRADNYYQTFALGDDASELVAVDSMVPAHAQMLGFFTSYAKDNYRVSMLGDLHPHFHGSVVRALASGHQACAPILRALSLRPRREHDQGSANVDFFKSLSRAMRVEVVAKDELPHAVGMRLQVLAPHLVSKSQPGHFFRLARKRIAAVDSAAVVANTHAVQASRIDYEQGMLEFILRQEDSDAVLLQAVEIGERLACMGPSGVRLSMPKDVNAPVLVLSDAYGLPTAALYARTYLASGLDVSLHVYADALYLGVYAKELQGISLHCFAALEYGLCGQQVRGFAQTCSKQYQAAKHVVIQGRAQFVKSIYQCYLECVQHQGGSGARVIGAVHGPMQCLLKGICARCLQWQIDPSTGERTKAVYACSWQDQPLELVDMQHLIQRNHLNKAQDKLYRYWRESI